MKEKTLADFVYPLINFVKETFEPKIFNSLCYDYPDENIVATCGAGLGCGGSGSGGYGQCGAGLGCSGGGGSCGAGLGCGGS